MDDRGVLVILEREIARCGSQRAFAESIGISPQFISEILKGGKVKPSARVLKALGLAREITYHAKKG